MSNTPDIAEIFMQAKLSHRAAAEAKKSLEEVMLRALRALMPADTILDLRAAGGLPPHLRRVRTMAGSDRGTKIFRIVQVMAVDANPEYPALSTWVADAVPVSEKTGEDMKASAGNGVRGATVRLHGGAGCEFSLLEALLDQQRGIDRPRG